MLKTPRILILELHWTNDPGLNSAETSDKRLSGSAKPVDGPAKPVHGPAKPVDGPAKPVDGPAKPNHRATSELVEVD